MKTQTDELNIQSFCSGISILDDISVQVNNSQNHPVKIEVSYDKHVLMVTIVECSVESKDGK